MVMTVAPDNPQGAPLQPTERLHLAPARASGSSRPARFLPLAAVLVPASILALVGGLSWWSIWQASRDDMTRAARSAAEYAQRTFEGYRVSIARVNDSLRGLSDADITADEAAIHEKLKAMASDLALADIIYVLDRDGHPLVSSDVYPVPRNVSAADRDFFTALTPADAPEVFISKTFVGRVDQRLLFAMSSRRTGSGNPPRADGFDGVVILSVSPTTVAEGLRLQRDDPNDRMALVRDDGYGLSTTGGLPSDTAPLPRVAAESPFYGVVANGTGQGFYVSTTAVPGQAALLAMQRVRDLPLYAVSLRPRSAVFAQWWRVMQGQLLFGLPATLVLFLLSLQVARDQARLSTSNVSLRRNLDLNVDRLDRAQRFGLVGTFEFDLATGVSRRSPEYMALHGMPAVDAIETHDDWARRLHPDDRVRAETEIRRALSAESGDTEYGQSYRIVTPAGEIRWIAAQGRILRNPEGRATMLLGAHVDVTPLRTTELALAESDARLRLAQEAVGIGSWEWNAATGVLTLSRTLCELWGFDPAAPPPGPIEVLSRVHPDDRLTVRRHLQQVGAQASTDCEFRVIRPEPGGPGRTLWMAARATLPVTSSGLAAHVMGIAYDITDRKRAEELAVLMAREVEHRAKNALALVSSLLRMTKADTVGQLAQVMDGRVRALSRTLSLLGQSRWKGASLADLVRDAIKPFELAEDDARQAVTLDGPNVTIDVDAAQPVSMALHELATNAAKYGALSVRGGSLSVRWQVEDGQVILRWTERDGPPLSGPPAATGFGSRLIGMLFEGQLKGTVSKQWLPAGLVCDIAFPLGKGV